MHVLSVKVLFICSPVPGVTKSILRLMPNIRDLEVWIEYPLDMLSLHLKVSFFLGLNHIMNLQTTVSKGVLVFPCLYRYIILLGKLT